MKKIAQGYSCFDVFCSEPWDYEIGNNLEALRKSGVRIEEPTARPKLPANLWVPGENVAEPADAALRKKLETAGMWRTVVGENSFPKEEPDMDYLSGAIYTAADIAGGDGLIVDRTSGIVVDAAKLIELDNNVEPRDTVVIHKAISKGRAVLTTRGLVKYGQRELRFDVAEDVEDPLCGFLFNNVFMNVVQGQTIFPEETFEVANPPFRIAFLPDGDVLTAVDAPVGAPVSSRLDKLELAIRRATGRA